MSSVPREAGPSTRAVHAGLPAPEQGVPFLPGPQFASAFHLAGDPASTPYGYGRYANPTWHGLEAAIGALEGGAALVFASGMSAVAAALLPVLRPGDVLVANGDGYPGVPRLVREHLEPRGVTARLVPSTDAAYREALAREPVPRVVWAEVPSNPGLDVVDLPALAGTAHAAGATVVADTTLASPVGIDALALGADLVVASGSKHLTGHSDLLLGHVAARDAEALAPARAWRDTTGGIPGPFEAWLAHRSIATLGLRLERATANAGALAAALDARDDVTGVRWPGLPGDPAHDAARRLGLAPGTLLGFDLGSRVRAERFLGALRLVAEATSFGGVHSTAERRARWGYGDAPEGVIRFSAGCEDPDDLVADVLEALDDAPA